MASSRVQRPHQRGVGQEDNPGLNAPRADDHCLQSARASPVGGPGRRQEVDAAKAFHQPGRHTAPSALHLGAIPLIPQRIVASVGAPTMGDTALLAEARSLGQWRYA